MLASTTESPPTDARRMAASRDEYLKLSEVDEGTLERFSQLSRAEQEKIVELTLAPLRDGRTSALDREVAERRAAQFRSAMTPEI